jgi:alkanesulfonate monooxygenase SsuD/methylene tetrahydromethanopterin reductase-like flavin-dependent oxidoreductase (luciferase family)
LHYSEWKYQDMVREPYGGRARVARPPRLSGAKEAELKETALVGSPIEVAHSIRAYCDAAGTGNVHFIARLYWPGMDASLQREAIAVFAEQVLPEIAGS